MNSSQNKIFESFDDSLHYYVPRISPFLTKSMFEKISKNPSNISNIVNKETYDAVTKHAKYECEPFFGNIKIKIYLNKKEDQYIISEKYLASYVLEQIFDDNDHLISQEIKKFF